MKELIIIGVYTIMGMDVSGYETDCRADAGESCIYLEEDRI